MRPFKLRGSSHFPRSHDDAVSPPWFSIAAISSHLLLLGILALPPLFLHEASLRTSKTLITVLALAAITAGLSLTPLLFFAIPNLHFRLYNIFLPCLSSCSIGLIALIFYVGVLRDASFPSTASVVSIALTIAAVVFYAAASAWVYRSILKKRIRSGDPSVGKLSASSSGRTAVSNGALHHDNQPYHHHSISNASEYSFHDNPAHSRSHSYSTSRHPRRNLSTSSIPSVPASAHATFGSSDWNSSSGGMIVGEVYGAGEAPVVKVTGAPPGADEVMMREQMARLLAAGEGRRVGESTFRIEMPREQLLAQQRLHNSNNINQTFHLELPKSYEDGDTPSSPPNGPSNGPKHGKVQRMTAAQIQILGPMERHSPPGDDKSHHRGQQQPGDETTTDDEYTGDETDAERGRALLRPPKPRPNPISIRARAQEAVDEELYRLSVQQTPIEMTRGGVDHARARSREDRRREIEMDSLSRK